MSVVIVDADPIIYAAGFASEERTYDYVLQHKTTGDMRQEIWGNGNDARTWLRENPEWEPVTREVLLNVKDVSFARQAAKTQLSSIVETVNKHFGAQANVETYLSGPGNYRYKVATIAPYKADRPPPPVHYQALRDYLTARWNAVVVSGMEADDKVSIRCRELAQDGVPFCLATIDKDLDQVPGLHYGYRDHVFYDVSFDDAERTFWVQVLSGDSTDNIPGCYKVGGGKAAKMVDAWTEEGYDSVQMWTAVVAVYAETLAKYPERYPAGMTAEQAALETARLVKMQEYEGQLWNPAGVGDDDVSSLSAVGAAR